jgi:hypothetical protein
MSEAVPCAFVQNRCCSGYRVRAVRVVGALYLGFGNGAVSARLGRWCRGHGGAVGGCEVVGVVGDVGRSSA